MLNKKGCSDELANYRALCILNHAYKILSICLLKRVAAETDWFLSDWQAGFRARRQGMPRQCFTAAGNI